jgi:hypothetical protein
MSLTEPLYTEWKAHMQVQVGERWKVGQMAALACLPVILPFRTYTRVNDLRF